MVAEGGISAGRDNREGTEPRDDARTWKKSVMSDFFSEIGGAVSSAAHDVADSTRTAIDASVHVADQAGTDIKNELSKLTSGAETAPTPRVDGSPPSPTEPEQWTAPSVNASGHFSVNHGALTDAADVIKKYVPQIEAALTEISSHKAAFESLMGWATGKAFGGNLESAVTAFHTAGTETSDGHSTIATTAQGTNEQYQDADQQAKQGVSQINSQDGQSGINVGAPRNVPGSSVTASPAAGPSGSPAPASGPAANPASAPAGGQQSGGQASSGNWT